jgi:hypothetical protein
MDRLEFIADYSDDKEKDHVLDTIHYSTIEICRQSGLEPGDNVLNKRRSTDHRKLKENGGQEPRRLPDRIRAISKCSCSIRKNVLG